MTTLSTMKAHGLAVGLPRGWEGRIFSAPDDDERPTRNLSVMHAGSFVLPTDNMHFGGKAMGMMRPGDFFVSLVEYGKPADDPWFRAGGFPLPLTWLDLSESFVRNARPGHVALQHFCHIGQRTFCLYVEAVAPPSAEKLTMLNSVLASIESQ